jgi:hypothetical protein
VRTLPKIRHREFRPSVHAASAERPPRPSSP